MSLSLDKVSAKAPELLETAKAASISLEKRNLVGTRAQVAVVLDHSGSMDQVYKSGAVQKVAERLLSLASQLDDDGEVQLFLFDDYATYVGDLSLDDYKGAIDRFRKGRRMGLTDYTAAFEAVEKQFNLKPKGGFMGFGKKAAAVPEQPVFAIFITDGQPNDSRTAAKAIQRLSNVPIFWKFISLGPSPIDFLQQLDDLDGRLIDNADYKHIGSLDSLSSSQLFDALLEEYPEYLTEARKAGIIK